jgi:hypothetical protein
MSPDGFDSPASTEGAVSSTSTSEMAVPGNTVEATV